MNCRSKYVSKLENNRRFDRTPNLLQFYSIRNTGMGFTSLLAMVIGIGGPYVVHLGTIDVRYPYGIMAIISICGAVAVSITFFKLLSCGKNTLLYTM